MTLAQVCKVSRLVVTFHRGAGWHHSLAKQGTHRGRRLLTCSHQISAVIIAASRGVVWCGVMAMVMRSGCDHEVRPHNGTKATMHRPTPAAIVCPTIKLFVSLWVLCGLINN